MTLALSPRSPAARRRCRRAGIASLVAAPLLAGLLLSSHIAAGRDETTLEPTAALVPDDSLDPRMLTLELDGPRWHTALAALDAAIFDHREAERGLARAHDELREIRAELAAATRADTDTRTVAAGLEAEISAARRLLEASAIARFVRSGDVESDILASPSDATKGSRRLQLSDEANDVQLDHWRALLDRAEQISAELSELGGRALELRAREGALAATIDAGETALPALERRVVDATESVRSSRRSATIPGVDIPVTALDAYLSAETRLAETEPSCGLEWWMIAGVGRVESRHGHLGGRTLSESGRASPEIIGVALDGGPNVRAIVDTDGGVLDGDPIWDRAVGPMQFIPETWSIRGRDGNGDGTADPHNIYDAAYSTGRFLCRLGEVLDAGRGLERAYFGYNTSDEYVADVSRHARRYREALEDRLP